MTNKRVGGTRSHVSRRALVGGLTAGALTAAGTFGAGPAHAGGRRAEALVRHLLRRMTLREKVGQLFVHYVYGATADTTDPAHVAANRALHGVDNAEQLLREYHLGGVIYFAWTGNLKDPRQIATLSNDMQRVAARARLPIPLTVATDQEYGVVYRFGPPAATQLPGAMGLGAGRSTADAREAAGVGAREMRAVGINQDYAPIADVNVNAANPVIGVRSFGEDPALVAELAAAQIRGYQGAGLSATTKHFPGHGDTAVDSHTGLPVIDHTREEWDRLDAPPFRAAVEAGVDAVMTAHIVVPALDPSGDPATLSRPVLTGLLREEMGYDGLVVTDSLEMDGVRQKYGDDRVPVLALKAGADQLLMPPDTRLAFDAVLKAVEDGELTERRIEESVRRVLLLKVRRGLFHHRLVDADAAPGAVGTPAHQAVAQRISDHQPTLLRNDDGLLPLSREARSVLVTGAGTNATTGLSAALARRGARPTVRETGTAPEAARIDAAAAAARTADLVVVATSKAWASPQQQALVAALEAAGTPVAVVAVRDPYDVAHLPDTGTYLAVYSDAPVATESAVRVLYGEIPAAGRLPVTVPTADDPGKALYPYGFGLDVRG